jgi:hypothetical protein
VEQTGLGHEALFARWIRVRFTAPTQHSICFYAEVGFGRGGARVRQVCRSNDRRSRRDREIFRNILASSVARFSAIGSRDRKIDWRRRRGEKQRSPVDADAEGRLTIWRSPHRRFVNLR